MLQTVSAPKQMTPDVRTELTAGREGRNGSLLVISAVAVEVSDSPDVPDRTGSPRQRFQGRCPLCGQPVLSGASQLCGLWAKGALLCSAAGEKCRAGSSSLERLGFAVGGFSRRNCGSRRCGCRCVCRRCWYVSGLGVAKPSQQIGSASPTCRQNFVTSLCSEELTAPETQK